MSTGQNNSRKHPARGIGHPPGAVIHPVHGKGYADTKSLEKNKNRNEIIEASSLHSTIKRSYNKSQEGEMSAMQVLKSPTSIVASLVDDDQTHCGSRNVWGSSGRRNGRRALLPHFTWVGTCLADTYVMADWNRDTWSLKKMRNITSHMQLRAP